ncbi:MAG: carotenoid 1,2-hydratase [Hydrogenophaga sp.]|nr:carotenoid 1,2-hydratase [Hydrogenophaga sp.]
MTPLRRRSLLAAAVSLPWTGRTWPGEPADRVLTPRALVFPRDHGSHQDTRTEWWYLTGHASDAAGREFGFQLTFFRSRVDGTEGLRSRLAARQLVFAHAAITDVQGESLWHEQRIGRWNGETPAQAGAPVFAQSEDTDVAIRDWRIRRSAQGHYLAQARSDDLIIELEATPTQPLLLQGDQGFSRKGPQLSQASFYVSEPQLKVRGVLGLRAGSFQVQGKAWLDHEWSESLLHPDAVGWDWMGMNLDDGGALTAFRLRRADGSALWAGGSYRAAGGDTRPFQAEEVAWTPLRHWVSPRTQARYPVEWNVRSPVGTFSVHSLVDAQELDAGASTGTVYWEGLSDLRDSQGRRVGRGYLEMTGYTGRLVL